ncbi:putative flagellar protein FliS [Rhodopseudomonas palustris HaA2]|uniref:Putative flagellar protein FliS n=1 Tax=Rhodopseudomonas palustris (strain HaA2) TaxID=316058 RepID=Q2J237_RHOP2|nr:flagellar export chaperone FliS [Rhodopseudomonas palustris]ABD05473.1 putative flagellar protein FliS [Rhodopseudomonas palustris HaA2]
MQNHARLHAAQAYRSAAVAVPPLRAVAMLLDGAIKALQSSIAATEQKRFEESHTQMIRATAILRGLSHHLNFDKGGAVAEGLHQTYHSLIMACLRSYGRPNSADCYKRIIGSLMELRNAWAYVALEAAKAG